MGVEFNGNIYFLTTITFWTPKHDFGFQGPKITKTGLVCKIHISHVTKLLWMPINFHYEGVLITDTSIRFTPLAVPCIPGGTTTSPSIPTMPGVDVSQRRVKIISCNNEQNQHCDNNIKVEK